MTARDRICTMTKESLSVLLAKLKDDEILQLNLKSAASLDDAVGIAQAAGFDVSKYDFLEQKLLIGPHLLWEWEWI
jgi:predicted ribosomally synthesized peptide with nif11-like leader